MTVQVKNKQTRNWLVYLLECKDGTFYCGITKDLKNRLEKHNHGVASKYTRSRLPVKLITQSPMLTQSEARKLEIFVKRLPKGKKAETVKLGSINTA